MSYSPILYDLWQSETGVALRGLVARSHGQLKLVATSKLAWLPRLTLSSIGEWIWDQPYEILNGGVKVVALGTGPGPALFGKISHIANAIHPLDSYEESTFTAIHIHKVQQTRASQSESGSKAPLESELNAPRITSGTKAIVVLNFILFLWGLLKTLYIRSYLASLYLILVGSVSSATGYLNRWQPHQIDVSSAKVHQRKRGDVMIYTNKGALILVTCSTEVSEELYFKFMSLRKDLDSSVFLFGGYLGLTVTVFVWLGVTANLEACDADGIAILFKTFIISNLIEILFGLLPSERIHDLSQYYWADVTPELELPEKATKLVQKEEPKAAAEDEGEEEEEASSSLPKNKFDAKFAKMFLLALVKTKDPRWVDALGVLSKTKKFSEAKTVLRIATIVMNPKFRQVIVESLKKGKEGKKGHRLALEDTHLTEAGTEVLCQVVAASRNRLASRVQTAPDPSSYHINSRARQQGFCVRILEIFQILVVLCAGRSLSWYPLPDPEREYAEHRVRVYSLDPNNPRKTRFYHDIPAVIAEALFDYPFSMVDTDKSQWNWSLVGRPKVFLHGISIMEVLLNFYTNPIIKAEDSSGSRSHTSQKDSSSPTSHPLGGESSGSGAEPENIELPEMETESSSEGEQIEVGTSAAIGETEDLENNTLFICADVASHDSRAQATKVGSNDLATIEELRRAYKALSTKWPKIKRITGIKFFRFHSFLRREVEKEHQLQVHIHKDKQRYPLESDPEYSEYRYAPKPWPVGLPFPIEEMCWYFLHHEDCGTSSALNKMLPARVSSDLENHRRAFGIYVEECCSVWAIFVPVVVLSCIILGSTLWFIKDRTDDLQTAIVPFTVACSIGTLVVNVAVSLLLFRMLAA